MCTHTHVSIPYSRQGYHRKIKSIKERPIIWQKGENTSPNGQVECDKDCHGHLCFERHVPMWALAVGNDGGWQCLGKCHTFHGNRIPKFQFGFGLEYLTPSKASASKKKRGKMEKGKQTHDVNLPETGSANYLVLGPYDVLLQCSCGSELVHRNLRLPRWALPGIENQICVSTTSTKTLNSNFSVLKLHLSPVFMVFSQVFINIFPMLIPMVSPCRWGARFTEEMSSFSPPSRSSCSADGQEAARLQAPAQALRQKMSGRRAPDETMGRKNGEIWWSASIWCIGICLSIYLSVCLSVYIYI